MTVAVVLAAGLGRRLSGATTLPKWLAPVGPTCPAAVQLAALTTVGIRDVIVVVGEEPTTIEQYVAPWRERLHIRLVGNEHSATRNNWYSLVVGLRGARDAGGGDVLVMNSDLFASPTWFGASIGSVRSTSFSAALAVDPTRGDSQESMKVGLDSRGQRVIQIGKIGVDIPGGEYVGLAWWQRSAADAVLAHLEAFIDQPERADHWYEHGIQVHLDQGGEYGAAPVASPDWVEIDDPIDLAAARQLISGPSV